MPAPRFFPGDTVACEPDGEWEGNPANSPQPGQLYEVRHICADETGWCLLLGGPKGMWGEDGFWWPDELPAEVQQMLQNTADAQAAKDTESIARRAWSSKPKKLK